MKIIGTGLTGLIGSRIAEILTTQGYTFEDLSQESGVDITDNSAVKSRLERSDAPWIFHFAAVTDVQGAETERNLGAMSVSWQVNVEATAYIASLAQKLGKHMMYISTDYVFDGTRQTYSEDDAPNPQGWYAVTKYEGEKQVGSLARYGLIVRIANPYRANPHAKLDFVHKMIDRLSAGLPITAPTDQIFVPTFIDDIARAAKALVESNAYGTYHVVGSSAISPYEAAKEVAKVFGFDEALVFKTTFAKYAGERAPFPQFAALENSKLRKFGITMNTLSEGLSEVKRQEQGRQ